ncbi:hypothetical protein OGATHE_003837 [Ogataea polymorpha]|uniref:Uncharacterized protein n=1 Tax=Ogataea polymorpha TaxID=460523 RepID=A0A9P8P4Y1_9ASCO|nr:hypothetical protein OGATHE_003837 [Ogataea polymorpha]
MALSPAENSRDVGDTGAYALADRGQCALWEPDVLGQNGHQVDPGIFHLAGWNIFKQSGRNIFQIEALVGPNCDAKRLRDGLPGIAQVHVRGYPVVAVWDYVRGARDGFEIHENVARERRLQLGAFFGHKGDVCVADREVGCQGRKHLVLCDFGEVYHVFWVLVGPEELPRFFVSG